ncbi:hypothetical protein ACLOJK_015230 [Asimina triloba]
MGAFGFCFVGRAVLLLKLFTVSLAWGREGHYAICKIAQALLDSTNKYSRVTKLISDGIIAVRLMIVERGSVSTMMDGYSNSDVNLNPHLESGKQCLRYFQGLLTEDAATAVRLLLPDYADGDLAAVCSWPDEIRHHFGWRWTSPLHYVDTPDFRCNYEYCRDCHDSAGNKDRCVSGAIYNYSMQLTTYQDPIAVFDADNLTEALMFLSHFIGDIHQPLHVGFVGDEGGNTIIVRWYRRKTNLHHVWDNMIIESAMKEFYHSSIDEMIQAIKRNMLDWSAEIPSWENCVSNHTVCPDLYASESVRLACKFAYRNATPGSILTDDYFLSRLPIVEKRLAQSGVRLAATLNRIFSSTPSRSQQ